MSSEFSIPPCPLGNRHRRPRQSHNPANPEATRQGPLKDPATAKPDSARRPAHFPSPSNIYLADLFLPTKRSSFPLSIALFCSFILPQVNGTKRKSSGEKNFPENLPKSNHRSRKEETSKMCRAATCDTCGALPSAICL
jgi:hypothetical protein